MTPAPCDAEQDLSTNGMLSIKRNSNDAVLPHCCVANDADSALTEEDCTSGHGNPIFKYAVRHSDLCAFRVYASSIALKNSISVSVVIPPHHGAAHSHERRCR